MAEFPSFSDLFRAARDEILIRNGRLSREAVERDGSDANVLIAGAAAMADDVVSQLITVQSGLFLDSAIGQALDRLVFDRYGLLRKPAAPGIGAVTFIIPGLNPSVFNIPSGVVLSTADGKQYITTSSVVFPTGAGFLTDVPVRSVLAGSDQQALPNTITNIITPIVGSPANLFVTNPLATAGASDAESDSSLRGRARAFFETVRRGTLSAIIEGALAYPGVSTANAYEALDPTTGHPVRLVELIISDQFTDSLLVASSPYYQAQSQILAQQVFSALDDVRAAGIYVHVTVAQVEVLTIILHLTFAATANVESVLTNAKATVVTYVNALVPGETFVRSDLIALIQKVPGLISNGNEVLSPPGDVVPTTPMQVIRTTLGFITLS